MHWIYIGCVYLLLSENFLSRKMPAEFQVKSVELLNSSLVVIARYSWSAGIFSHAARETDGLNEFASGYRPFVASEIFHGFYIWRVN